MSFIYIFLQIGRYSTVPRFLLHKRLTILHVSRNGEILDSLHTLKNKISNICEAHIFEDTLYLGSFTNDYIGKVSLSKIGWDHLRTNEEAKRKNNSAVSQKSSTPVQDRTSHVASNKQENFDSVIVDNKVEVQIY